MDKQLPPHSPPVIRHFRSKAMQAGIEAYAKLPEDVRQAHEAQLLKEQTERADLVISNLRKGIFTPIDSGRDGLPKRAMKITRHWNSLHQYAIDVPEWSPDAASQWLAEWVAAIPGSNTNRPEQWQSLVAACPPTFISRESFFEWTVEAHNIVNRALNKPIVTLKQAEALYHAR